MYTPQAFDINDPDKIRSFVKETGSRGLASHIFSVAQDIQVFGTLDNGSTGPPTSYRRRPSLTEVLTLLELSF